MRDFGAQGLKFTTVGLGTWNMEKTPRESLSALRKGIEEGANHIDTAEMYGEGRVEEIVKDAIAGQRERVYVVSKVLPSNADYKGTVRACERSLKRLKTDYLDVYLLHWREDDTQIEETFRAFERLKQDGKIRFWGVSNFDVKDMEEAVKIAGKGKIVCNQVLYHVQQRAIEFDLIPWCREHGVAVMAYSPFGQARPPESPALKEIANAHGATAAQVILAFLTRDPAVFTVPKSSDIKRTRENVQAMKLKLTDDECARISKDFPARASKSLPML